MSTSRAAIFESPTAARRSPAEALAVMMALSGCDPRRPRGASGLPAISPAEAAAMLAGLSTPAEAAFNARYREHIGARDKLATWLDHKCFGDWRLIAAADATITNKTHAALARAAVAEYIAGRLPDYKIRRIVGTSFERWPSLEPQFKNMTARLAALDDQLQRHIAGQLTSRPDPERRPARPGDRLIESYA